eukprot:6209487-Pleurochrysis_carterae.AAC.5
MRVVSQRNCTKAQTHVKQRPPKVGKYEAAAGYLTLCGVEGPSAVTHDPHKTLHARALITSQYSAAATPSRRGGDQHAVLLRI